MSIMLWTLQVKFGSLKLGLLDLLRDFFDPPILLASILPAEKTPSSKKVAKDARPATKAQAQAATKAETKATAKAEAKAATKAEAKAAAAAGATQEAMLVDEPEVKSELAEDASVAASSKSGRPNFGTSRATQQAWQSFKSSKKGAATLSKLSAAELVS